MVDQDGRTSAVAMPDPALLHKKMLQLLSGLWITRAVGSFARLGLADAMADGAQDHAAIAAARGLLPDRVYRLLRALSTVGIVAETGRGQFALTPLGAPARFALTRQHENYCGLPQRLLRRHVDASR